jgi:hypothetical protein
MMHAIGMNPGVKIRVPIFMIGSGIQVILSLLLKHNTSLKVVVQGPDYCGPPLIHYTSLLLQQFE